MRHRKEQQPETAPEKSIPEKVVEALALPKDASGVVTVVNITDMSEIVVDGFRGIIEYTDSVIRLNTPKFMLKIDGRNLEIKTVATDYISIKGCILGVEYIR